MSYATQTDLLKEIPEAELIRLTDDDHLGVVNTTIVAWALDRATNTINAHIPADVGLTVPLTTVPEFVRDICTVLAQVELFGRRRLPLDETTKMRFTEAMKMLGRISTRQISIQTGLPVQSTERPAGTVDSEDRIFTRDELDGM